MERATTGEAALTGGQCPRYREEDLAMLSEPDQLDRLRAVFTWYNSRADQYIALARAERERVPELEKEVTELETRLSDDLTEAEITALNAREVGRDISTALLGLRDELASRQEQTEHQRAHQKHILRRIAGVGRENADLDYRLRERELHMATRGSQLGATEDPSIGVDAEGIR